eukprot:3382980-Ditylum_brightwellii.AAC.1
MRDYIGDFATLEYNTDLASATCVPWSLMGFNDDTMSSTKPVTDTTGALIGLNIVLMGNLEVNFFKKLVAAAEMETVVTATSMTETAHILRLILYITN